MWSIEQICCAVRAGLCEELDRLEAEQAVYGLDARDELGVHGLLARVLEKAGFGVHREQRYPEYRQRRRASEGLRCDLVLTPNGRSLARPEQLPTFFDPPDPVPLCDAYWLEVKLIAQFRPGGPNRRYSSLFTAVRGDINKLTKHQGIYHCGLLILMFVADLSVADHDLGVWRSQCTSRGFAVGDPASSSVPVADRLGNKACRIGLFPIERER